jgi:hypothetical protein
MRMSRERRDERARNRGEIADELWARAWTLSGQPRSRPVTPTDPPLSPDAVDQGENPYAIMAVNLADIQVLLQAVQAQGTALTALTQNFVNQNAARIPREIEAALPVFGGRADEDVGEFIGAFTRLHLQQPLVWTEARLKQTAVGRLVGLALEWEDRVGNAIALWPAWSAALRAAFHRTLGLLEWGRLMEGRTQSLSFWEWIG